MKDADLQWRVEDVSLNGRPSPIQIHHDGWLIRSSGGPVRRTNSLNPTRHRSSDLSAVLDAAEAVYDDLGRPTIVRVPSIADEMDDLLAERGYGVQAPSLVLLGNLDAARQPDAREACRHCGRMCGDESQTRRDRRAAVLVSISVSGSGRCRK